MTGLLLSAALLLFPAGADDERVEIFTLQYRTADEVLPTLLPMIEGQGAITGSGTQIFVRARPAAIAQVRDVLRALDTRQADLMIHVRQVFERRGTRRDNWSDRGFEGFQGFEEATQKVRMLEGREAQIEIRRDVPRREREARITLGGIAVVDDWWFESLGAGFWVAARLMRDGFTLDIVTRHAPKTGARGTEHELRTSVSGALRTWIEIGHVLEEHARRRSGPLADSRRHERTQHSVLVKVESLAP